MSRARAVVLDNEAVQALTDPKHRKHRRVMSTVEAVASRNLRRAGSVQLIVPTAVRVEAGWDRRAPQAAAINRLQTYDVALDTDNTNQAARVRVDLGVSVADAHIAAVLSNTTGPHAVLTSDVDDLRAITRYVGVPVEIIRI